MKPNFFHIFLYVAIALTSMPREASAQRPALGKLSSQLRMLMNDADRQKAAKRRGGTDRNKGGLTDAGFNPTVCAFVRTSSAADTTTLKAEGCRVLASLGDITIAAMPLNSVAALSRQSCVLRIEAQRGNTVALDSLGLLINVPPVHEGRNLPQAFDGTGVVVGMQDVGFDLTHPTFLSDDTRRWRIKSFWDQLAKSESGSSLFVGADYTDEAALRDVAHSRDAHIIGHGTLTTSIAAGTGYGSPYRGMAPGSDICMVSNAVNVDAPLIPGENVYKYTYATDVLGFKYIFDYAQSKGQPCVINFSEGSPQDFRGDDVLYFEALRRLTGPGRILVSSAGNNSINPSYFRKPVGTASAGTFIKKWSKSAMLTMKTRQHFKLRLTAYGSPNRELVFDTKAIVAAPDSTVTDTLRYANYKLAVDIQAFPSCYDEDETAYDVTISGAEYVGVGANPLSMEVLGSDADVEVFCLSGQMYENSLNPALCAGEKTHNINSPSAAPSVICVGATAYRTCVTNFKGETIATGTKDVGDIAYYSSVGPTFAGLTKPDVVAPGSDIISAYSSFYIEADPTRLTDQTVATFDYEGRTYAWYYDKGTSLSSPAVAGTIALWLQAVPTLSREDVMEVIAATSIRHDPSLSYPNNTWGYGEIDAYRGLLHLLKLDSVKDISVSPSAARMGMSPEGLLTISLPSAATRPFTVCVYSVGGQLLHQTPLAAGSDSYTVGLQHLSKGVYAIQINSCEKQLRGSTLVRR